LRRTSVDDIIFDRIDLYFVTKNDKLYDREEEHRLLRNLYFSLQSLISHQVGDTLVLHPVKIISYKYASVMIFLRSLRCKKNIRKRKTS